MSNLTKAIQHIADESAGCKNYVIVAHGNDNLMHIRYGKDIEHTIKMLEWAMRNDEGLLSIVADALLPILSERNKAMSN